MEELNRKFGNIITRLIQKTDFTREEIREAFRIVLQNNTTEMQQGAFLAALSAKGETEAEVAGAWDAIYELDTQKVFLDSNLPIVENSGTGMDTFKTFNISTAASLVAAAGGVRMARHGARAITSVCGTVDMAEALGVDVECPVDMVAESIRKCGIGLFNGMSPETHPTALFRILSNICFGSTLNIAASLANPALPQYGVRGVFARDMIMPVIHVMKAIGYQRAIVLYGGIDNSSLGMDEASVCGNTWYAELTPDGTILGESVLRPEDLGMEIHAPDTLAPNNDLTTEARQFVRLIRGQSNGARKDAILLNTGLIFYVAGKSASITEGIETAARIMESGQAVTTLETWVSCQNRNPEKGLQTLERLISKD